MHLIVLHFYVQILPSFYLPKVPVHTWNSIFPNVSVLYLNCTDSVMIDGCYCIASLVRMRLPFPYRERVSISFFLTAYRLHNHSRASVHHILKTGLASVFCFVFKSGICVNCVGSFSNHRLCLLRFIFWSTRYGEGPEQMRLEMLARPAVLWSL